MLFSFGLGGGAVRLRSGSQGTAPKGQQGGPTFDVTGEQTSGGKMGQFGKPSDSGNKQQQQQTHQTDTGTANEIRRKYKAGQMSKEDAIKALQSLGFS